MTDSSNQQSNKKRAIIIGAGPAGLTAALELLERTDFVPIILEQNSIYVGGISKTVVHNGNRIDIGGHRFFSKSDRVMNWWRNILPLQKNSVADKLTYQNQTASFDGGEKTVDPDTTDEVMLVRSRKSRIYYNKKFFNYPIELSLETVRKLGLLKMAKIGLTYSYRMVKPIKPEKNLEDFYINRFGGELYRTFFESYTQKVWGVPCREIDASWGAQRVKGLSIIKVIVHFLKKLIPRRKTLDQKGTETSLIEWFLYPKYGPGQLWEVVAKKVQERGGQILMGYTVTKINLGTNNQIESVVAINPEGQEEIFEGEIFFSTMPIKNFIAALNQPVPEKVGEVAAGLLYRDFITVGLLLNRAHSQVGVLDDNWIYIHDPRVTVCRVQFFNNWSPYMVADSSKIWLGMEYVCSEGDNLWQKTDAEILALAKDEIDLVGLALKGEVIDGLVLREYKTYPAYFGTYDQFSLVKDYLNAIPNLYPLGRNGMHRYNNQDHSMLTAMVAVDNIVAGRLDKENMWSVNTEQEYHEEK